MSRHAESRQLMATPNLPRITLSCVKTAVKGRLVKQVYRIIDWLPGTAELPEPAEMAQKCRQSRGCAIAAVEPPGRGTFKTTSKPTSGSFFGLDSESEDEKQHPCADSKVP